MRSVGSALVSTLAMGVTVATARGAASAVGGALLRLLGLVGVDDVDAHVGEHRHGVLDLLGGHFLGREHLVQLVIGDEPAGLRRLDQLLDRGIRHIQHGTVRSLGLRLLLVLCFSGLGCHSSTPKRCSSVGKREAKALVDFVLTLAPIANTLGD